MTTIIDHFLFFTDRVSGDALMLDTEEAYHASMVLRIQRGAKIFVTDGKGAIYFCAVEHIDSQQCTAGILEKRVQEPPKPAMHFFIGVPEKEAFENTFSGLVPLGVLHITPVVCRYCQKPWWRKQWEKHARRFTRKIISAAKQSWNAWLPVLHTPVSFETALAGAGDTLLVADDRGKPLGSFSKEVLPDRPLSCFTGPPGGFSIEEREMLLRKNAHFIKLSGQRLRTELAAAILAGNLVQACMKG
jgi:16S rRNA (uracil1498-N3)-methyltransferase